MAIPIPVHDQNYIWPGGSRKLANVALSSDAALITDDDPCEAAYGTLSALKKAVSNKHSLYLEHSVWPSIMTLSPGNKNKANQRLHSPLFTCPQCPINSQQ